MKKVETMEMVFLTCDSCGKVSENYPPNWYNFEAIDTSGLRLYEKLLKSRNIESKHFTKRREVNFCCKECAKEWLVKNITSFIEELSPIEERERDKVVFGN